MKYSVFIVEDNPMYSFYVNTKLDEMFNYVSHYFPSAEEAIENMRLKPDVIVLDYMLTGIDGIEATRRIMKINPNVKIIIMSAQTREEVKQEAIDAGAYRYVQKDKVAGQKIIDAIIEITGTMRA